MLQGPAHQRWWEIWNTVDQGKGKAVPSLSLGWNDSFDERLEWEPTRIHFF
jgi:hypothetical protein